MINQTMKKQLMSVEMRYDEQMDSLQKIKSILDAKEEDNSRLRKELEELSESRRDQERRICELELEIDEGEKVRHHLEMKIKKMSQ